MIHNTRLFLCDHGGWSCQITGHSYYSRRIGIDICVVFTPITSMTHWSSHSGIYSYNTTPTHVFLATWNVWLSMTLFILHIVDIERLVTYMILEYSFGRGLSNCHWSFRNPSKFVLALLGWHPRIWFLPFNPLHLIGMNCHNIARNHHGWIGINGNMNI